MGTQDHCDDQMSRDSSDARSGRRAGWVFGGFAAFALLLLAVEHRTHLLAWLPPWWPWLIALACPLMHLFMHGGHGSHVDRVDNAESR